MYTSSQKARRCAAQYWKLRYEYGIAEYADAQRNPDYRQLIRRLRERYNATSREINEAAWLWHDSCQYYTRCVEAGLVDADFRPVRIFG